MHSSNLARGRGRLLAVVLAGWAVGGSPVSAQTPAAPVAGVGQTPADIVAQQDARHPGFLRRWLDAEAATGDWREARSALADRGVVLFGGYLAEVWGNTRGGIAPGAVYTGLFDFGVDIDLEKLAGWPGASFHNSWFYPHGGNISESHVGNLFTVSNAAAQDTLVLYELWIQQELLDGIFSVRLGQLAADEEFAISDYGALFLNATFGWPPFLSENMPNVGPAFPRGSPGVRLAWEPAPWLTFLAAAFQADSFSPEANPHGFRWDFGPGVGCLWMNEAQVRWFHDGDDPGRLPGQAKAGFWYQNAAYEIGGNVYPNSYGFYVVTDQMIHRAPGATAGKGGAGPEADAPEGGMGWFGRIGFGPSGRSYLNFYGDTGLTYKGLLPGRPGDTAGVAVAMGRLAPGAAQQLFDEGSRGVGYEMVLEATYQCQVTPWLIVQPDLQWILHPGATRDEGNALVIGARASIIF